MILLSFDYIYFCGLPQVNVPVFSMSQTSSSLYSLMIIALVFVAVCEGVGGSIGFFILVVKSEEVWWVFCGGEEDCGLGVEVGQRL